ncbi:MAG: transporter [Calditrichaeota bacterium]|nr:MAG: transporter [Calditrichota bacterium]MBL1205609.1 transporter [Calditrichota bacterium]NOG45437.1 YeeE/YedE family protein [Calditrichota bacterium]
MRNLIYLFLGLLFGIVLIKSEVINWFRIQAMFNFEEPHMYLIFAAAIATGVLSILVLKYFKIESFNAEQLNFKGKTFNRGFIWGGLIFGIGWAITGACPGPVFAQIGSGEYPALFTLLGAVIGAYGYQAGKSKLPH